MMEKNNQETVNFDQGAVNPLNSQVKLSIRSPASGGRFWAA